MISIWGGNKNSSPYLYGNTLERGHLTVLEYCGSTHSRSCIAMTAFTGIEVVIVLGSNCVATDGWPSGIFEYDDFFILLALPSFPWLGLCGFCTFVVHLTLVGFRNCRVTAPPHPHPARPPGPLMHVHIIVSSGNQPNNR